MAAPAKHVGHVCSVRPSPTSAQLRRREMGNRDRPCGTARVLEIPNLVQHRVRGGVTDRKGQVLHPEDFDLSICHLVDATDDAAMVVLKVLEVVDDPFRRADSPQHKPLVWNPNHRCFPSVPTDNTLSLRCERCNPLDAGDSVLSRSQFVAWSQADKIDPRRRCSEYVPQLVDEHREAFGQGRTGSQQYCDSLRCIGYPPMRRTHSTKETFVRKWLRRGKRGVDDRADVRIVHCTVGHVRFPAA